MDEIEREIASSLLPWLNEAKNDAIDEPADRLHNLTFGNCPLIEQARALVALVDRYPQVHARLSQTPRYLGGVEVAHHVLSEA